MFFFFYLVHKCHPKHPDQKGNDSGCCAKYGPCPLHFGDCNKDSECEGDLKCNIADKGNTYGYSNNYVDVCGSAGTHIVLVEPLNIIFQHTLIWLWL